MKNTGLFMAKETSLFVIGVCCCNHYFLATWLALPQRSSKDAVLGRSDQGLMIRENVTES